jgi:hypothetical protein
MLAERLKKNMKLETIEELIEKIVSEYAEDNLNKVLLKLQLERLVIKAKTEQLEELRKDESN